MSCSGVLIDGSCGDGGASNLQQAYDNSTSPEIVLSANPGGLVVTDAATPLSGNLLDIQSNNGAISYFSVNSTSVTVNGKLNVTGLIDPTGLVLDQQATVPGGMPGTGKGTIWVKNTSPTQMMYTDNTGTDYDISVSNPANILTTKGDLLGRNNFGPARVAVGSDGQFLKADSTSPTGISYTAIATNVKTFKDSGGVTGTTTSASFTTIYTFNYNGSPSDGSISSVKVIAFITGAGSYSLRLQDVTNNLTIAQSTGLVNTTESIINLGTISNIPLGAAILVVQAQLNSGVVIVTLNYASLELGTSSVSSVSLQDVYNQSGGGYITVDSVRGPFGIEDNIVPLGTNLFEVDNNTASVKYFTVSVANTVVSNAFTLSSLTASSVTFINASNNLASIALNNGNLLIGSTGANPVAAGITGTSNQVIVNNGAGSITLSTPQNINTGATPSFAAMNLTNTTNQLALGTTNITTLNVVAPSANRTYSIPDTGANSNFVMTDLAQTINGIKTFSNTLIASTQVNTPVINNGGNITVPNTTDQFVCRATTDTLTNKNLVDNSTNIVNSGDATKTVAFSLGSINTGITNTLAFTASVARTLTFPDATDQVVCRSTTDILSNKALNAAVIVDNSTFKDVATDTKTVQLSLIGITTGFTNTLAFTATANQTITFPNITDTLVTKTTTDNLSNKSLLDGTTNIVNSVDNTKKVAFSLTGITTGITNTLAFTATTARTLTFPDATDQVVCRSTTDTLTNKSLVDNSTNIVNSGDNTKTVAFSLGSINTGVTNTLAFTASVARTLTFPDATDQVVCRSTTDILSNKALNAAVIVDNSTFKDVATDTKTVQLSLIGITTGFTNTLAFTATSNQTITFPNITDTLVTKTTTDTLTNKSLVDNSTNIANSVDNTKKVAFSLTGITTGITNTLAFTATTARTLTFPNITDTLVTKTTTDTLTNKSLVDNSTNIVNSGDNTKTVAFSLGSINTGITNTLAFTASVARTITFPDATDQVVCRSTTDILSNKALNAAVIVDNSTFKDVATNTKTVQLSLIGITTGFTNTLAFTATSNQTLTFPNITDTLVTKTTTDTLTNKSLVDNSTNIINSGDNTKTVAFSLGSINTGITNTLAFTASVARTITFPDATDQVVCRSTTDILSNKALNAAVIVDNSTFKDVATNTKTVQLSLVGITTNFTNTLAFTATANQTITFPNITDTLVTKTTTDNLSNKSLLDGSNNIVSTGDTTKKVAFLLTGITTGITNTLAFTATTARTLTFPDATDQIVCRATTDTLTNKSLVDNSTNIVNSGDNTKKVAFSLGSINTGITNTLAFTASVARTLTFPDATDQVVCRSTTDILSNKALNAAVIVDNSTFKDVATNTKTVQLSLVGITTNFTNTLAFTATANQTITFPNITDTLVTKTTTDILSNKSLVDNVTSIINNADNTKKVAFLLTSIATGITNTLSFTASVARTLTFPDATDQVVCRSTTDSLTNKSLSDASTKIINSTDSTKKVAFSLTGITTGITNTLAFTATTAKTITFPNITDTLVTKTTTDILSNKSLVDNVTSIINSGDNTKTVAFSLGSINTGVTNTLAFTASVARTITFPDATDQVVCRSTTDILSNKALNAAVIVDNSTFKDVATNTKTVQLSLVGITTNFTNTLAFTATANRTITFPDATDQIVCLSTTDTLSNKTLTSPIINNASVFSVANNTATTCTFNNTGGGNDVVFAFQSNGTNNNVLRASPGTSTNFIGIESTGGAQGYLNVDNINAFHNATITFQAGLSLPTSGGTASSFNYYEETTLTTTFTGPWATGSKPNIVIKLTRVGRMVNAYIPSIQATGNSTSVSISNDTALPTRFRPSSNNFNGIYSVLDGASSTNISAGFTVNTLGVITFSGTIAFGNFPATTNTVGPNATSLTWVI